MKSEEGKAIDLFSGAKTDADRLEILNLQIEQQENVCFGLRYQLTLQESVLEGFYKLRETLGAPALSHKHTLRGRVIKYLTEHPSVNCTDLAKALSTPVTTMNMCLNRNKNLFEKDANNAWKLKPNVSTGPAASGESSGSTGKSGS